MWMIPSERLVRRALIATALAGLLLGLATWTTGRTVLANWIWAAATVPVVLGLAIALLSMAGALALGENLAAVVVAVMYAGGNVLEDFAVERAERDLKSLVDRAPRTAHRREGAMIADIA